jgi:hypothetical protein
MADRELRGAHVSSRWVGSGCTRGHMNVHILYPICRVAYDTSHRYKDESIHPYGSSIRMYPYPRIAIIHYCSAIRLQSQLSRSVASPTSAWHEPYGSGGGGGGFKIILVSVSLMSHLCAPILVRWQYVVTAMVWKLACLASGASSSSAFDDFRFSYSYSKFWRLALKSGERGMALPPTPITCWFSTKLY